MRSRRQAAARWAPVGRYATTHSEPKYFILFLRARLAARRRTGLPHRCRSSIRRSPRRRKFLAFWWFACPCAIRFAMRVIFSIAQSHTGRAAPPQAAASPAPACRGGSSSGWHNSACPSQRPDCRAPPRWDAPAQYHTIRGGTEPSRPCAHTGSILPGFSMWYGSKASLSRPNSVWFCSPY